MAYNTWTDDHNNIFSEPYIPEKIVGFHGIDPDLVSSGGGNNGSGGNSGSGAMLTHEDLEGLLGGDDNGHYHLTPDDYEALQEILQIRREENKSGETFYKLTEEQYYKLRHIIEAVYPDDDSDEPVFIDRDTLNSAINKHIADYMIENQSAISSEALNSIIDARIQQTLTYIDCGEVINTETNP